MKTRVQWFSVLFCVCLLGGLLTTVGCGESAPPPAPAIEEPPTEEYNAGEAAYQKQG